MTCEELRQYFEEHFHGLEVGSEREAVVNHTSTCAECRCFVDEQRSLARNLASVRQLAGQVPESLDAAVMAKYRQFMEREQIGQTNRVLPLRSARVWVWGAAVAAVIAVAAFWVFGSKPSHTVAKVPPASSSVLASGSQAATSNPVAQVPGGEVASNTSTKRAGKHHASAPTKVQSQTAVESAPVRVARSLPEGFRSLMYCDALSCPEDMEMIRVQLPSSALPRPVSGLIRTSGSVTADVLVGPDGIARGIRLEEIEF